MYGVYLICWVIVFCFLLILKLFLHSSWLCIYFYLPSREFFIVLMSVSAISPHACMPYTPGDVHVGGFCLGFFVCDGVGCWVFSWGFFGGFFWGFGFVFFKE